MPPTPTLHDPCRVVVWVLAYEAATTLVDVLDRIPAAAGPFPSTVVIADDASTDSTVAVARSWVRRTGRPDVEVVVHPHNLGYGGNQIAGMQWAADRGFDVIAMLHGDGQYPPEALDELVAPIARSEADAVFGSRMIDRGSARAGGMPRGRFLGNRALTTVQNRLARTDLSEWHSGLRAYRVTALRAIDAASLPTGFEIDTVATLRLISTGATIEEIAIPTRYAGETSRIRPVRDGFRILAATVRHRRSPFTGPVVEVAR